MAPGQSPIITIYHDLVLEMFERDQFLYIVTRGLNLFWYMFRSVMLTRLGLGVYYNIKITSQYFPNDMHQHQNQCNLCDMHVHVPIIMLVMRSSCDPAPEWDSQLPDDQLPTACRCGCFCYSIPETSRVYHAPVCTDMTLKGMLWIWLCIAHTAWWLGTTKAHWFIKAVVNTGQANEA